MISRLMTISLLLLLSPIISCPDRNPCYNNQYRNLTSYNTSTHDEVSPLGIRIKGRGIDPIELDRQTLALENCLGQQIRKECILVLVPDDWYVSECTRSQLFPCDINPQVCIDKGITWDDLERCPCNCRATIQDENTIITTPDLLLYRAELVRMVSGINNPWASNFSHCLLDPVLPQAPRGAILEALNRSSAPRGRSSHWF